MMNRPYTMRTYYSLQDFVSPMYRNDPFYAKRNNLTVKALFDEALGSVVFPELTSPELTTLLQDYIWPRFYECDIFFKDNADDNENVQQIGKPKVGQIVSWCIGTTKSYGQLAKLYEQEKANLLNDISSIATTEGTNTATNKNTTTHDLNVHTDSKSTDKSDSTATAKTNEVPQIITTAESDEFVNTLGSNVGHTEGSGTNLGDTDTTGTIINDGTASDTSKITATTSTNKDTMINRLDEINQKLVDIYTVWSNDFGKNFIIW